MLATPGLANLDAEPEPRFSPGTALMMLLTGFGLALIGELYMTAAPASTLSRVTGLVCMALGAVLFGVGAIKSPYLPRPTSPWLPSVWPQAVFRRGTEAIAGAVGGVAFLALIWRLLIGSSGGSDLLLWFVAMAACSMSLLNGVRLGWPSRSVVLEMLGVGLVVAAFMAVNVRDLNHWYYSAIGDEYAFLDGARGVLRQGIQRPFTQDGVYGAHPMLGTVYQAGVMWLVGNNHWGWSFSSVLSAALAIPAMYLIGRALADRAVGLLGAAMFGFNHYLFAFSHLGYNNIMAPTPATWSIALFAMSMRRPHPALLYGSGIAAGLGFYTFYSARATLPILAVFYLSQFAPREWLTARFWKETAQGLWPMALGFVLAAGPIFAVSKTAVITRMLNEVPGGYNADVTGAPIRRILGNAWLNVPAFFHNTHAADFISGSLLDPLTAAFVAVGIALAIRRWRHTSARLLLAWAGVAVSVTALLSPYQTTAVTRLLFDVPALALLGALAARQLWASLLDRAAEPEPITTDLPHALAPAYEPYAASSGPSAWKAGLALAGLAALILALNVYRFWVETPPRLHLSQEAVMIGALRSPTCGADMTRNVVVVRGDGLLRASLLSYGPENQLPRIVRNDDLRPGQPLPIEGAQCVIFGHPGDDPQKRAVEELQRAHPNTAVTPFQDYAKIGTILVLTRRT